MDSIRFLKCMTKSAKIYIMLWYNFVMHMFKSELSIDEIYNQELQVSSSLVSVQWSEYTGTDLMNLGANSRLKQTNLLFYANLLIHQVNITMQTRLVILVHGVEFRHFPQRFVNFTILIRKSDNASVRERTEVRKTRKLDRYLRNRSGRGSGRGREV